MTLKLKAVRLVLSTTLASAVMVAAWTSGAAPDIMADTTPPAPSTGQKALLDPDVRQAIKTNPDGSWLSANPCQEITYAIDPTDMPYGWDKVVTDAADLVQQLSGVTFRQVPYEDLTLGQGTFSARGGGTLVAGPQDEPPPLLVGFVSPDTSTILKHLAKDNKSILGFFSPEYGISSSDTQYIASGAIGIYKDKVRSLNPDSFGKYGDTLSQANYDRAVTLMLHEFGHFLGLEHVADDEEDSIMQRGEAYSGSITYFDIRLFSAAGALPCK